jgi:signal transduction histidine kinase
MLAVLFAISSYFAKRSVRPIEESWKKQKQFVADASHELKTPIAIIGSNMDAILASGEETVDSQKEWFGYMRTELTRLNTLIGDLLYLAKSEDSKQGEPLPFDLNVTVEKAIASMEAMIYEKTIDLETHIEKNVLLKGDEEKIKQAALILLDNAAKYTSENGKITVILKKLKGQAILQVQNTGSEIPQEDLSKIFDRFYRPDASRSQDSGGYGLGLSIAKTIVERSGGTISAQSISGINTFTIELK